MPLAFLNLAPSELIVIAVVAILVWGRRLPEVAGQAAGVVQRMRRSLDDLRRETGIDREIQNARRAVDDDGTAQRIIKTVHGRGFRFVANARRIADATAALVEQSEAPAEQDEAPSIAVLPFPVFGEGTFGPGIGDAIPAELISALSRLRSRRSQP